MTPDTEALPPLPDHPSHTPYDWTERERAVIEEYARAAIAADRAAREPAAPQAAEPGVREALQRIVDWDDAGCALTEDHITQACAALSAAPAPEPAREYADYQQQRGVYADIVDEALGAYVGWLADDDFDAAAALHRIMRRMAERRDLYATAPLPAAPQAPAPSPQALDAAGEPECHGLDTPAMVRFYEHDFYVLSNFSSFSVQWRGFRYPTSEHVYHVEKFRNHRGDIADLIAYATSAHEAFKIAERNRDLRRPDWDAVKVDIMRDILRLKAAQHEYVRRKLLATGDRLLVEDSWRDDFWGWGPNRDGQNMLGRLWMEVRAELRASAPAEGKEPTP